MAPTRRRGDRSKNLVGFTVGEVHYAVDILRVREIIAPLPVVQVPHAPEAVLGVCDHRGEVVPVLDLRQRFGLEPSPATRRTKWIVVELGDRLAGFVVDGVTEVFGAGANAARSVPELGAGDVERGISAVYSHDSRLVFVLDVERIASPTEELDFASLSSHPEPR